MLGALRTQLILQFLGESVLMSMVALALAACLVELLLPGFNTVFGKELSTSYLDAGWVSSAYALVAVSVGSFPVVTQRSFCLRLDPPQC